MPTIQVTPTSLHHGDWTSRDWPLFYAGEWFEEGRKLGRATNMMVENLFKKIIDKLIPASVVYEDDICLAFRDVNPQAPVHVLIVPRKVIRTHDDIAAADKELLGHMHIVAIEVAKKLGLGDGYRLVINCKEKAGQTVPHLHMHLLGGREMKWPPG
jgi:histidine triad (HIT) family protein